MTGARRALIVANDIYEHEGLKHLLAPGADAEALAGVLGDARIGDFGVHVVRNEPAHVIQGHIEELFSESRAEDVLLLHFSCHGLKGESGELFFAARNTRPNRLASTAVSADFVQRCMRASRSRSIVLLLDCCYGGAFSQGVAVRAAGDVNVLDSFPGGRLGGGRGRAVITASSAMEYAFEGNRLADDHGPRPSVFTSALAEGLATGEADRDQDGWVSLNELYDYVFDRVRERNPHQTPSRDVEMQGELYVARRARPVTTPAPLPAELQQAIDHPLAGVRAGAVQELARLVRGKHAGLALAARLALRRLADDDSRTVSSAATAALAADSEHGSTTAGGLASSQEPPPRAPHQPPSDRMTGSSARSDPAPQTPLVVAAEDAGVAATAAPGPSPASAAPDRRAGHDAPSVELAKDANRAGQPVRPTRRRLVYAGVAGVVLAVTATIAGLVMADGDQSSPNSGRPTQGDFTATSPWRLVIRDAISGQDNGCTITLTHTDSGEKSVIADSYGEKKFQIAATGRFRWTANDPGCIVIQRPGPGNATPPFVHKAYSGDTDAFTAPKAPGKITLTILDASDSCDLTLRDAKDGGDIDLGTILQDSGPLRLDPHGRSQVYLADPSCTVRVSTQ